MATVESPEVAREVALANVVRTYEAIALSLEGAFRIEGEGYRGVLSPVPHGVANMVFALDPTPSAAHELARIAEEKPELFVYLLPSKGEPVYAETIRRAGFRVHAIQAMMVRPNAPYPTPTWGPRRSRLVEAETLSQRIELMEFLTKQFFEFGTREFRGHLAVATTRAAVCRLWEIRERRLRVAGAMTTLLGGGYGLYDVAVRDGYRGAGLGRELVMDLLTRAPAEARLATLQCHRPLLGWYEALGFESVGEMTTFVPGNSLA